MNETQVPKTKCIGICESKFVPFNAVGKILSRFCLFVPMIICYSDLSNIAVKFAKMPILWQLVCSIIYQKFETR